MSIHAFSKAIACNIARYGCGPKSGVLGSYFAVNQPHVHPRRTEISHITKGMHCGGQLAVQKETPCRHIRIWAASFAVLLCIAIATQQLSRTNTAEFKWMNSA